MWQRTDWILAVCACERAVPVHMHTGIPTVPPFFNFNCLYHTRAAVLFCYCKIALFFTATVSGYVRGRAGKWSKRLRERINFKQTDSARFSCSAGRPKSCSGALAQCLGRLLPRVQRRPLCSPDCPCFPPAPGQRQRCFLSRAALTWPLLHRPPLCRLSTAASSFFQTLGAFRDWSCAENIPDIWGAPGIHWACSVLPAW